MLNKMTRRRAVQVWFAAVALVFVAAAVVGAEATVGTVGMLLALSIVPPVTIFVLWPGAESVTGGDVLRGTDGRG